MNTCGMYKNVLGWQSLDDNNTATYIAAHVNTAYDNAYYSDSGKCMFIGDGGTSFSNLGSIDVIGHEMSHGVTAATSNLACRGESGGLNESHSDIGGEVVEAYARAGGTGAVIPNTGNDWMTLRRSPRTASRCAGSTSRARTAASREAIAVQRAYAAINVGQDVAE